MVFPGGKGMDFTFTKQEKAFRQELREFMNREMPPGWSEEQPSEITGENWPIAREFGRKLAAKGWLGLAWPEQYGGQGRSQIEQLIFDEELAYHRAPRAPYWLAINRVGPSIMAFGTEAQKRQHLRGITNGEVTWCQGFTEPNAGSDLASLETRAVEDGNAFVVNGEKWWTTHAHLAQWCVLLARTDPHAPKHRGITYFLLDMDTPGVTVRPLIDMHNEHEASYVFLNNVRIPREQVLGNVNQGWQVATTTLDFERTGIQYAAEARRILDDLVDFVGKTVVDGKPLAADPVVQNSLAEAAININISRLHAYRLAWLLQKGSKITTEASISKLVWTESWRRLADTGMQILGPYCQLRKGSNWVRLHGILERYYIFGIAASIAVGATEIQKNILAVRGLGLPR